MFAMMLVKKDKSVNNDQVELWVTLYYPIIPYTKWYNGRKVMWTRASSQS